MMKQSSLTIDYGNEQRLDAILIAPADPQAVFVFAHGAGAGMDHSFMQSIAEGLALRNVATLRYNFPYMASGKRYPDRPPVLRPTVAAAIGWARRQFNGLTVLAGGKSFGGRMTADAIAEDEAPGVDGLVFLGYPLHPPGKEGTTRSRLLPKVDSPMLFLQGSRDKLAKLELIDSVTADLDRATLYVVDGADHSFSVTRRSGRTRTDVYEELVQAIVDWLGSLPPVVKA